MELVLKPSVACNFKCTFCSSTELSEDPKDQVSVSEVEAFIRRFPDTETIVVNGGDPLMMPVQYYWDIIEVLDRLECPATLSITTNLWPFYKKPEMWAPLFRHPRVGVTTSFQYGGGRRKGDYTVFTEEDFLACSDAMLEHVGYRPDFIAVIDRSNEDTVIQTVELAKRLGVECKLNYATASGTEVDVGKYVMGNINNLYTVGEMYRHYVTIWDAGLAEWEHNTREVAKKLKGLDTTCPLARECDTGIRTLQPGGGYYSCGHFGDIQKYPIDFKREMAGEFFRPLQQPELDSMKQSCYTCPLFGLCNGCKKTIHDTKRLGLVETHCQHMKTLAPKLIEMNGLTGVLEPTPYVDESIPLIFKG